jgi:hypothetical protein
MDPEFNLYSWLDGFNVSSDVNGKLIDIPDWMEIILKLIPESSRDNICAQNLFIEIANLKSIAQWARRRQLNLSDIWRLREVNPHEYVNLAKRVALNGQYGPHEYTPNELVILIENNMVINNLFYDINIFFNEDIDACPQPIIFILVKILTRFPELNRNAVHVNALIIDKIHQTFELFDPYGKTSEIVNAWFTTQFRLIAGLYDYQYLSPVVLCPNLGPQHIAEKTQPIPKNQRGYCYTYTLMYIQMRLANPNLSPTDVVTFLLSATPEQLRHYAMKYNAVLHTYYKWPFR